MIMLVYCAFMRRVAALRNLRPSPPHNPVLSPIFCLFCEVPVDFRQCHALIQRIQAEPTSVATTSTSSYPPQEASKRKLQAPSANAVLAAKNVQRGLAAKIQEKSALFRKKQRVYMDRLQGHAIKNQDLLIASGAISLHGSDGLTAVEEDMAASRSQLSSQMQQPQQQQQQQLDAQTQERTRELAEIAKNIASLADLFKDLSTMVIEQGTILDSVEYNIERTADAMEGAVKELKIAQGYQRNTGRRQCIFFLVLLIFATLVVLIFKPRRS
ncbi:t-SNARE [Serendipita vermifera]|nr:t-SNARE [Serendipita vermifera]